MNNLNTDKAFRAYCQFSDLTFEANAQAAWALIGKMAPLILAFKKAAAECKAKDDRLYDLAFAAFGPDSDPSDLGGNMGIRLVQVAEQIESAFDLVTGGDLEGYIADAPELSR